MSKKGKGSSFERDICERLSYWWTNGKRDDVFWRSAGSGARATVRRKSKGKKTSNADGDITFTDACGAPLIDCFTFELKRGYAGISIQDLLDLPSLDVVKSKSWISFLRQTIESYEASGSYSWMLITRKDRREALCIMPYTIVRDFRSFGLFQKVSPMALFQFEMDSKEHSVFVTTLDTFFDEVSPKDIKNVLCQ